MRVGKFIASVIHKIKPLDHPWATEVARNEVATAQTVREANRIKRRIELLDWEISTMKRHK